MYRNTKFLIIFLAIFAAIVAGVNIGKQLRSKPAAKIPTDSLLNISVTPTSSPSVLQYISPCGFSLRYPSTFSLSTESTVAAMLVHKSTNDSIVMSCQKNISRPAIPLASIDTRFIQNSRTTATISAKLYHDKSPEDGTLFDALIFRHPTTGKDVFIVGYGPQFDEVIKTLTIQ